jgi:hypothetical protein
MIFQSIAHGSAKTAGLLFDVQACRFPDVSNIREKFGLPIGVRKHFDPAPPRK